MMNENNDESEIRDQKSEIRNLKSEIKDQGSEIMNDAELVRQRDEYLAGWQRARADYENLKKETSRERALFTAMLTTDIVIAFLPLYDFLNAATVHPPHGGEEIVKWVKGVEHIAAEFLKIIGQFGITPMETVGTQFDAALHESVGTEHDEAKEEGIIIKELQAGFMMNGRVVRHAKIIINEKNK